MSFSTNLWKAFEKLVKFAEDSDHLLVLLL